MKAETAVELMPVHQPEAFSPAGIQPRGVRRHFLLPRLARDELGLIKSLL